MRANVLTKISGVQLAYAWATHVDAAFGEGVGQGFVDELLRVFAHANPGTKLIPVDMLEPVELMVRRALQA